jgi:hypothetical protein
MRVRMCSVCVLVFVRGFLHAGGYVNAVTEYSTHSLGSEQYAGNIPTTRMLLRNGTHYRNSEND